MKVYINFIHVHRISNLSSFFSPFIAFPGGLVCPSGFGVAGGGSVYPVTVISSSFPKQHMPKQKSHNLVFEHKVSKNKIKFVLKRFCDCQVVYSKYIKQKMILLIEYMYLTPHKTVSGKTVKVSKR